VTRGARTALAIAAGLVAFATAAAGSDVRRVEAVGAVPIGGEAAPPGPPRDAAVRAALQDAAQRLALELLSADFDPIMAEPAIAEALGDDPFRYATRFRILEDRGERPALLVDAGGAKSEYVVMVEAFLDVDRIRQRMAASGLLEPSGESRRIQLRVVVEGLESYRAYASLRRVLLDGARVRSAQPLVMERGRVLLRVVADREAPALLEDLLAAAPADLRIVPLAADRELLRLRVREVAEPFPAEGSGERVGHD
jgi:hypothetical protein